RDPPMTDSFSISARRAFRDLICAALFIAVAIVGLSGGTRAEPEPVWPPKTMPISFWCGPPEPYITTEQYRQIAAAGFSVVMPPCEGEASVARNKKILDTAKATGLKAIIQDSRMPLAVTGNPAALANLKAIVKDYRKHPALLGYFITDEPGANAFGGLAEVVAELKRLDPDHIAYINLLPSYATSDLNTTPSQLQTDTYDRYLTLFMQNVKPQVLSWDFYHFLANGDRPGFYGNLYAAQGAVGASQPPTPFWQIVLSVQHGGYRALSEPELRFEAMQTLVFGGSGLLYFTYWQPNDPSFKWSNSIRNRDGTPGPLYEPVKHVNAEVRTLAKYLYGAELIATFQSGDIPPDGRPNAGDVPLKVTGPGNLSVGFFRGETGHAYALATNRDYKSAVTTAISFNVGSHELEILDIPTNRWRKADAKRGVDGRSLVTLELPPAGAALVRWL
ncbi:MAG TPA: hypothetical protein VKT77_06880, partial [Chthonomonadaceae bacterium]|nr:hypothetical protein [Chthonomonadaceae bacterium]